MEETKLLSKNLIKANQFVLKEKEPLLVDTNALVAKKLGSVFPAFREAPSAPTGFQSGLNAPEIDPSLIDMENGTYDYEGMESAQISEEPAYRGPSPEELIAEAQAEIEEMRKEAEKNIGFLKKRSMEEGRQQGYEEGRRQAMAELESARKELAMQAEAMEQEYQQLISELEPKFIHTLTGIYEEIFHVDLKGYKNILLHVINNTIRHIEGSKEFFVHINRTDYEKVMGQKEVLMEGLPAQGVVVELIADASLRENECMIETNSGIYDCGVGLQLEELTKKLRLLSYEG